MPATPPCPAWAFYKGKLSSPVNENGTGMTSHGDLMNFLARELFLWEHNKRHSHGVCLCALQASGIITRPSGSQDLNSSLLFLCQQLQETAMPSPTLLSLPQHGPPGGLPPYVDGTVTGDAKLIPPPLWWHHACQP